MRLLATVFCVFICTYLLANDALKLKKLMDSAASLVGSDMDKSLSLLDEAAVLSYNLKDHKTLLELKKLKVFYSIAKNNTEVYWQNIKSFENTFFQYKTYLGKNELTFNADLIQTKIYYYLMIGDVKTAKVLLKYHTFILKKQPIDKDVADNLINDLHNISSIDIQIGNFNAANENLLESIFLIEQYFPNAYILKDRKSVV